VLNVGGVITNEIKLAIRGAHIFSWQRIGEWFRARKAFRRL
jgi:hypothetical protein